VKVDLFDFELPPERIALRPASPRDSARLLVLEGDRTHDAIVRDLPSVLRPGDLLVFNDTRVIPAQLEGTRGDAKIGATLHKREGPRRWRAFIRNAKRLRDGDTIDFGHDVTALAADRSEADGSFALTFSGDEPVEVLLERCGRMPLPPYIASKRPTDARDADDYQTMFAAEPGAVAAPTAALHFTPELLASLDAAGVAHATLTLHVGAGTFLPVKADDTADHRMHAEWGRIDQATADRLNKVRAAGGRVIAVGTTSLRLIESAAGEDRQIRPFEGDTAIFITPGYRFKGIDGLLTNFHLPRSTLFMLVSALMGLERMKAAYGHAIENDYRFYSYGDASLLLP
jgi:S-adenosylmethionine:tRNA ribosyltransferase-isomerase